MNNRFIIDEILNMVERLKKGGTQEILQIDKIPRLLIEIVRFFYQSGKPVPPYINLELLQNIMHKRGYLSMELAAVMIGLASEIGNGEMIDFIYGYYSKHIATLDAPMSISLATQLVKLARERGDGSVLDYFVNFLLKRLQKRKDIPVELALEVTELALEVGGKQTLARFIATYMYEITVIERRPPLMLVVAFLRVLHEIDDQQTIQIQKLVRDCFGYYMKEMIRLNMPPELTVQIIKIARKINDQEILTLFHKDYLEAALNSQMLRPVELAVELLKLVQEAGVHDQASIESFYHKNITPERCYFGLLPIDTIIDLRRLAQKFGDDELMRKIDERLKV